MNLSAGLSGSPNLSGRPYGMRTKRKKPPKQRPHFVKAWRDFRGLTQDALAEKIQMSVATISQLETGDQGYRQATLEAIADALGTDPGSLLTRDPLEAEEIGAIWGQVPDIEKTRALDVLRAFIRPGTPPAETPPAEPFRQKRGRR